ncbi:MAG TPA: PDZ domain-containing protein [Streptosporangiaceae bacterium]|nr:PDZ domain-containing protein [Streptosporangiaceae bacterium]
MPRQAFAADRPPGSSHRLITLLIAGCCVVVGLVIAAVVSVPYVALTPGPTLNTLGRPDGKELIQITGRRTYPTTGNLNLVTVSYTGGPGTDFNIFSALRAWLTPDDAVVPASEIYSAGQSQQQVIQQDTEEMLGSQQDATAAALCYLNIGYTTQDPIVATVKGTPAYGVLQAGDKITAVDGTPIGCHHDVVTMIRDRRPGAPVTLTIDRGGVMKTLTLATKDIGNEPVVGVELGPPVYQFPFSVKINLADIGGPSAGLMFALGIVDKLTPDSLTGGRFIAGTGEIEPTGGVEPIGGIQQKMAGARAAGATIFLTPAANCPNTSGAVPAGLRLVKVSSLAGAISELQAIKAGKPVPSC